MTLLAPAFLAGLLAIALPIWLHRLSSENPNRKQFSSLMFLEAGEPQRVLAKNVQYLLLLALRIALLVLLVLAFIQPALWRTPPPAGEDGARMNVIVVDRSASMAAADRWDQALDAAGDLIDDMPLGDAGQIVGAGRTLELITAATNDPAVLRQGLAGLEPGLFHADYGQLTRALDGLVRNAELPVVLHFVTDAQASGLPARFAELAPTAPAAIVIHQVGDRDEPNWAVESLVGSAVTGELTAAVTSYADEARELDLSLELNGRVIARESASVEPGATAAVEFPPLTLAEGSNRVRVSLDGADRFEADDQRLLALRRPTPRPVLVVAGSLRGNDALFVASALETLEALALSVTTVQPGALADEDAADYAFIVVADAAVLDPAAEAQLTDYVESGGGLLLGVGPRSTALAAVPVTGQTFATATQALSRDAEFTAIGVIDTSHSALRGLEALRSARFSRYNGIEPGPEDRVLAAFENGAPYLIESGLSAGRVLIVTSSLGREWNDLPLQPVFVPFAAGLADHLLGGAGFSNEAGLGTTLALRAMGLQGGQIFDPTGEPALGLGGTDDVLLDQTGFYELAGGGRSALVAVNFDSRESDLAVLDPDTIGRWEGLGQAIEGAAGNAVAGEPVLTPFGRWLLLVLLAAVVMESLAGNWHLRVRRGIAA